MEAADGQNSLSAAAPRLLHAALGEGAMQDGEPWRLPFNGSDATGSLRREKKAAGTLQLQPWRRLCDLVTAVPNGSACVMPLVLLATSTFTLSSKLRPKQPKSRQNMCFGVFPPKELPLRGGEKKSTFTETFVGDCQFDLSCNLYGKTKRLGGLFRPRRVRWS